MTTSDSSLLRGCEDTIIEAIEWDGYGLCELVTTLTVDGVTLTPIRTSISIANCCLAGTFEGGDAVLLEACPGSIGHFYNTEQNLCFEYISDGSTVTESQSLSQTDCCIRNF